ncbi:MAG: hypothetical protein H5U24_04975 [Thioclava marina]|nr:hypothetical protein [Thioclava marina]
MKAAAKDYPEPSAELCSIYRQGPVVHRRMPVYYGAPSEDSSAFYWIDFLFRPEYLFDLGTADLPRPDGLPNRDLLFDINIADGQPLPLEYRRSARPQEDRFFTLLLLGGLEGLQIDRYLATFANWHIYERDRFRNGEIPQVIWTGDFVSGIERIELQDLRQYSSFPEMEDFFADLTDEGEITAVMSCDIDGTVPLSHCDLKEKSEFFEMDIGGFRRNQLDRLEVIRRHARNFTACLTWEGE